MTLAVPLTTIFAPGFKAYDRSSTVTIGSTQIANIGRQRGLDVGFSVKRTLKAKEANTCDLKVWGLSEASRKAIEQASQKSTIIAKPPAGIPNVAGKPVNVIPVRIDAGYVGHTSTIFLGEMRSGQSVTDGPDIVTELDTGDGDTALALQRINQSFGVGTTPLAIARALLAQMGVGNGNLAAAIAVFNRAPGAMFQKGLVLKGNASDHLIDICASVGLEFSVQNGQARFLPTGAPLAGQAYVLSSDTGLVGTPSVDTQGIVSFMTFILPGIEPGAPVQIDSAFVQGLFRIIDVQITGETFGNDWYCRCEGARYGVAP
jgi:hypothetical protein